MAKWSNGRQQIYVFILKFKKINYMVNQLNLFWINSLILAMSIMSLISLVSPYLTQWTQAFFTTRLILGLASVIQLFDNPIKIDIYIMAFSIIGFGVANNPATFLPMVRTGWTWNVDRFGICWFHAGQFDYIPVVRFSLRVRLCWWMAIYFLPFR